MYHITGSAVLQTQGSVSRATSSTADAKRIKVCMYTTEITTSAYCSDTALQSCTYCTSHSYTGIYFQSSHDRLYCRHIHIDIYCSIAAYVFSPSVV
jgi:hypothetical protein